uniref:Follicle stimulating hormone beta subunit n=1 Tax=Amphiprion melanopus TaxID=229072 RepID=C4P4A0_9TELE|nr:follicle stimulating hormone beta subunit [Amphiprion melanopus]
MQLVVMAAVLMVAEGGRSCGFGCRPTNISIQVESCGSVESVFTTVCSGQCYHEDPIYIGDDWAEQQVCSGDWSYEVKHISGCPVAVTYPVAKSCRCSMCDSGNTDCGRFDGDVPKCPPF